MIDFHLSNIKDETFFSLLAKPPPPKDITAEPEPLEFLWNTSCIESSGRCHIRYRTKGETDWPKV